MQCRADMPGNANADMFSRLFKMLRSNQVQIKEPCSCLVFDLI